VLELVGEGGTSAVESLYLAAERPEEPGVVAPLSEGFTPDVAARLRTYVYLLVDPRTGRPFFVGRGKNDQCFRHLLAARLVSGSDIGAAGGPDGPDPKNAQVVDRIRAIEATGSQVRIDILRHGLTPAEAKLAEGVARDALGLAGGGPGQRAPASEITARLARKAKFQRGHQVVLLRTGTTGSLGANRVGADVAEHLREGWRIGRRWIQPESPRSPHWAVLVADELVEAVFRIDGWVPTAASGGQAGGEGVVRYAFRGERDPELEQRYRGRSVRAYLAPGSPSPVTYVWCGPHWVNTPH
jgi:hypothetical protein